MHNTFTNNTGGVLYTAFGSFIVIDDNFINNAGQNNQGILLFFECSIVIANCTFDCNFGSLYIFSSNLTIGGHTKFENGVEQQPTPLLGENKNEGGAITSIQSILIFLGKTSLSSN